MRKTCLLVSLLPLTLGSCAHNPPKPTKIDFVEMKAVTPTAPTGTVQAENVSTVPSGPVPFKDATVKLSFTLPDGWDVSVHSAKEYKAQYYLSINRRDGVLLILPYPTAEGTPIDTVKYWAETEPQMRSWASSITEYDDGNAARLTWCDREGGRCGLTEARILPNDRRITALITGSWSVRNHYAKSADFNSVAASVRRK